MEHFVRWVIAWACAVAAGCSHSIARVEHAPSSKGQIAARVTSIDGSPRAGEARVLVTVDRALEQTRLLGASVRHAHDLPCTGVKAGAWGRESGARAAEPWLLTGETLAVALPGWSIEIVASSPSKLDLLVRLHSGETRCIPVTISESAEGLTFESVRRFTLGLDLGLDGYTQALGSVTQGVFFTLVAGAWIDRVHVHAGAGIGGASCRPRNLQAVARRGESGRDAAAASLPRREPQLHARLLRPRRRIHGNEQQATDDGRDQRRFAS